MRQSVRLGRVAGIPVGAHWSVVVIAGLIAWVLGTQVLPSMAGQQSTMAYWAVAVPGALLFIAALLGHELAHAYVAHRAGVPVRSITLWALGGVAELGGEAPTARSDLAIAIAGPAASLVAAAGFGGLAAITRAAGGPALVTAALAWLAFMNALLGVFNLLPGAPLDGGRVLRALVWLRTKDRARAARAATTAGRFVGAALVGAGALETLAFRNAGGLWLMLIGVFVASSASMEATAQVAADALRGLRVGDVMMPSPAVGAGWISVSNFIEEVALHSAQTVFPVIGFDGQLLGVVTAEALGRIPAGARGVTPLRQLARPVPPAYLAAPGDPATSLLTRRPLAGELLAVVLSDGRIVGIVTTQRLRQVLVHSRLSAHPVREPSG